MEHFSSTLALIGLVIVTAALLSGLLERSRLPLVAIFLVLGVALGPLGFGFLEIGLHSPVLNVLAILALALVLFADATYIEKKDLRANSRLSWLLLGPGTLVPAALHTLAAHLLLGLAWLPATILGAALASTDPVLLRGAVRSKALPPTPRMALRVETGMNDVLLLPIVSIAMLLVQSGTGTIDAQQIGRSMVGLFLLGPATGALTGWLGIIALVWVRTRFTLRRDYESLYALGLAFTAYALAEAVGGSGFLAAFTAGLMVAVQDVELCDCFREYGDATAEMLLLLTFVALGTSAIWSGLGVLDGRTLAFAAIALGARAVVLYPTLARAGVRGRDRQLIALLGPRGLGSLLLTLLPVFAGIPDAERLFAVASLVVLLSLVIHGVGIALLLRAHSRQAPGAPAEPVPEPAPPAAPRKSVPLPVSGEYQAAAPDERGDVERITIDGLKDLWKKGEEVIVADVRADRSYREDDLQAKGAVRLDPDNALRDARAMRLSQRATLVVYCA